VELVLGVDLGTSYFKLGLFDRDGNICGLGRVLVAKDAGDGSRCELPVGRFWRLLQEGLATALDQAKARAADIRGLAYSSQANSFVLLDESAQPLSPLVLWPDQRVESLPPRLSDVLHGPDFLQTTGIGVTTSPLFSLAKLAWFQDHRPDLWSSTRYVMNISDYLTFALTRSAAGDMGTAALLGLLDLQKGTWWDKALAAARLSSSQLPVPMRPGAVAGAVCADGADRLPLAPGIPFVLGSLDHHAAAVGAGVGQIADLSVSLGTVLACLHYSREYQPKADCCLGPGLCGYEYYELGFDGNGAGPLEWYQATHAPDLTLKELDRLAGSVAPGSDGLTAVPGVEAQLGLTGFRNVACIHHHGHFFRALMESSAATLQKIVATLCGGSRPGRIVATGGGARSDPWLQIQTDVLGIDILRTACTEPACLGAALLAARAADWFTSLEQASAAWISVAKIFRPDPETHRAYTAWRTVKEREGR